MNKQVITRNAGYDEMTEEDYMEMLEELLTQRTLRQFVQEIGSEFSHAAWGNWRNRTRPMPRNARNELRRAVGMPLLPPTVAEAMAQVSENATVTRYGFCDIDTVALYNAEETPAFQREALVTGVTRTKPTKVYDSLFDMPRSALAWQIRNRVEV